MVCLANCVIIITAKLCIQRLFFSHDVELNNKGIFHFTFLVKRSRTQAFNVCQSDIEQ